MGDDKKETISVVKPLITFIFSFLLLNKRANDNIIAEKKKQSDLCFLI